MSDGVEGPGAGGRFGPDPVRAGLRADLPPLVADPARRRLAQLAERRFAPDGARVGFGIVVGTDSSDSAHDFRMSEPERIDGTRTIVLAIHGEADIHVADELESRLFQVVDEEPSTLVLDLSEVTFLDSMALGVLLHGLKSLAEKGGQLRIVTGRSEIRRIFELTLLDRLFELDASREEALAATASG